VCGQRVRHVVQRLLDRGELAGDRVGGYLLHERAEVRVLAEALLEQRPSGLAMRHQVVVFVEQLEARSRGHAGMIGPHGQPRDEVPEWPEHPQHDPDGRVGQRSQLLVALLRVREVALEDLQQDLVAHVEQVPAARRETLADLRHRVVVLTAPDGGEHHRPDRIELRVRRDHLAVLVEDLHELAEVRVLPVTARALALLEDRVDRPLRTGDIGHHGELRPAEVVGDCLGPCRADEQVLLADLVSEVPKPLLDRPI